jgi:hypothetical protein
MTAKEQELLTIFKDLFEASATPAAAIEADKLLAKARDCFYDAQWGALLAERKAVTEAMDAIERKDTALREIAHLCQTTCLSFVDQSFEATKIARAALK